MIHQLYHTICIHMIILILCSICSHLPQTFHLYRFVSIFSGFWDRVQTYNPRRRRCRHSWNAYLGGPFLCRVLGLIGATLLSRIDVFNPFKAARLWVLGTFYGWEALLKRRITKEVVTDTGNWKRAQHHTTNAIEASVKASPENTWTYVKYVLLRSCTAEIAKSWWQVFILTEIEGSSIILMSPKNHRELLPYCTLYNIHSYRDRMCVSTNAWFSIALTC